MIDRSKTASSCLQVRGTFIYFLNRENLFDKAMYCRLSYPLDLSWNCFVHVSAAAILNLGARSMARWLGLLLGWL